ncbi:MAG: hypothetical protein JSS40_02290 [Proteobacteria bacterium]|nr:hypothetical protein [Pseudomonadota bacterium]
MSLRLALCVLAALALAACAVLPRPQSQAGELVGYFAEVARMAPAEQKKALAQAADDWAHGATPLARVRLGGLYAQPGGVLRDDARALALLEPLAGSSKRDADADRDLADLAWLLHAQVAERQRLARDDAKKQEALREQNESIRERLEAMKAIERSIQRREERLR